MEAEAAEAALKSTAPKTLHITIETLLAIPFSYFIKLRMFERDYLKLQKLAYFKTDMQLRKLSDSAFSPPRESIAIAMLPNL